MELKVGVLGMGEVGKAIALFYERPYTEDLDQSNFAEAGELDILHICIPWSDNFLEVVCKRIGQMAPKGVSIIHSTVPVGTTEYVAKSTGCNVAHSPIRGVHPNLHEGIREFVKFVGSDSAGAARIATAHLESLGIKTQVVYRSRTTELLKLLDTTYYGLSIAYHDYADQLCELEGLEYDHVMTLANRTYNEGYASLGMPDVIRPVLKRPRSFNPDGKIGGHCIVPNAEILKAQYGPDPLLESIIRHKK